MIEQTASQSISNSTPDEPQATQKLDEPQVSGKPDERVKTRSSFRQALIGPELGGICGTILVFVFFFLTASDSGMFSAAGVMNWSVVSAQFIIIAVGACLLMISGEFDLSVGSMIGFSGMSIALLAVTFGWPVWLAIITTFILCMAIGALIGWVVTKTGLPSFIVSLAFLFILRGLTIFAAIATTNKTIVGGIRVAAEGDWLAPLFGGKVFTGVFQWMGNQGWIDTFSGGLKKGQPVVEGIPMLMVWAFVLVLFAHFLLTKTKFGNWIFASGGNAQAALYVGVPVNKVKILMFMFTAFCACVFATSQVMEFGSAGADRGLLKEFEAIISVVIGGALLTGGYGSVIGAALGAIIFGVVQQGLFFAGVESSLFRVFLGTILLFSVILNTYIRRIITGEK
ncbi:MAG: simple sugar transport system permease protein [Psychromonas sp.]|jgi:simple sugar transport system permease protein